MKQVFSLMYWNIMLYIDHIVSFELWTHQILKKNDFTSAITSLLM